MQTSHDGPKQDGDETCQQHAGNEPFSHDGIVANDIRTFQTNTQRANAANATVTD